MTNKPKHLKVARIEATTWPDVLGAIPWIAFVDNSEEKCEASAHRNKPCKSIAKYRYFFINGRMASLCTVHVREPLDPWGAYQREADRIVKWEHRVGFQRENHG